MAKTAPCPSCGAPVVFQSAASVLAVCGFCQSTLLRQDAEGQLLLKHLGTMAAMLEDRSPVQLGTTGEHQGQSFSVIGRLQLRYDAGHWNEWHLLFDDGRNGWLSESGGEYVLSHPVWTSEPLPGFDELEVGQTRWLDGKRFQVTNVLQAECVGGEGELPFQVGSGYPAPVADLRDPLGHFATLDYSGSQDPDSATPPMLFVGRTVPFEDLQCTNTREVPAAEPVAARVVRCPQCGTSLNLRSDSILSLGCTQCGAVLDTSDPAIKAIGQGKLTRRVEPLLPLGSVGTFDGESVEVIGFMRRRMKADGVNYFWSEYVLLGKNQRLLWLTEYEGHWNKAEVLSQSVLSQSARARAEGIDYKHFQKYAAHVDYVLGEFPWRVRIDEVAQVDDYVAPPRMLSRERTEREETWTRAEYLPSDRVSQAFKLKTLPPPKGVFANQPNPRAERWPARWRTFLSLSAIGIALHFILLLLTPAALIEQRLSFSPDPDGDPRAVGEFRLAQAADRLEIEHRTGLHNNWLGLHLMLVNKDTGEAWQASRELSYYEGIDDGESWSEGSTSDELIFTELPAGQYVLLEEFEPNPSGPPVAGSVRVGEAGPRWSSLLLLLMALGAPAAWLRYRMFRFEVARWAESDHPIVTDGDDDD